MEKAIVTNPLIDDPTKLKEILGSAPSEPGCYLMIDHSGSILYVGKSKNLKKRVTSYFRKIKDINPKTKLMVAQVNQIEFIVTDTENEALTLESNLIKKNQPYFNVLLKDDKKYPYVCITWSESYPRLFITRRRRGRSNLDRYYGPYVDVKFLRDTIFTIKKLFPMRQRSTPLYKDRTCLNYSIGRCPGVCQEKISSSDYHKIMQKVAMIFQGRNSELIQILKEKMEEFSASLEFEKAAVIRDQLCGIESLSESQKMILPDSSISRDVIAIASDERIASIQIFQMRSGKLVGRLGYTYRAEELDRKIVIQRVIEEHYSLVESVEIPNEIFTQYVLPKNDILQNWLTGLKGNKVNIRTPRRRKNHDLVELVSKNAKLQLTMHQKDQSKNDLALEDIAQLLDLSYAPSRIECFDISHIQGSDAVASQVVFIHGIPAKQHYRKYKIKSSSVSAGHSDDFMAMAEIMRRRFRSWSRLKAECGDIETIKNRKSSTLDLSGLNDWPDLIVIDGGKGQLSSVMEALRELDLDNEINVCSLAKRKEEVYVPGKSRPLQSEPDQLALLLLRQLRDEAHRFAISFHRHLRGNRMHKSSLSLIPGLGPKRIRELLKYFKSIDAIELASTEEISAVPGFGKSIAVEVWKHFHPTEERTSFS